MSGPAQLQQHGTLAEALLEVRPLVQVDKRSKVDGPCIHEIEEVTALCYLSGLEPGEVTPVVDRRLRDMMRSAYFAPQFSELRITVYPCGILGKVAHQAVSEFGLQIRQRNQPKIMWMVHKVNLSFEEGTGQKCKDRPPASFLVKPFGSDCVMVSHSGFTRRNQRILAWVDDPNLGSFSISPGHLPVFAVQEGQDPVPGYLIVKRADIRTGVTVQAQGTVFPEQLNIVLPERQLAQHQ